MATKINSLTIVSGQGVSQYFVGRDYNGLVLAKIEDRTVEFSDSATVIFAGLTSCGELVFEAINAPIEVCYEPVEPPCKHKSGQPFTGTICNDCGAIYPTP